MFFNDTTAIDNRVAKMLTHLLVNNLKLTKQNFFSKSQQKNGASCEKSFTLVDNIYSQPQTVMYDDTLECDAAYLKYYGLMEKIQVDKCVVTTMINQDLRKWQQFM